MFPYYLNLSFYKVDETHNLENEIEYQRNRFRFKNVIRSREKLIVPAKNSLTQDP